MSTSRARRVGEELRLLERDAGHLADRQQSARRARRTPRGASPAGTRGSAGRERSSRDADVAVGQRGVLGDHVDDVHPEAVDPAVQPPAHHRVDGLADLRVLPVEVGLLAREQVQVVLAGRLVELPRRSRRRTSASRWRLRRATSTSRASGCRAIARDSTNHGCSSEVWLTTRSITSFMPRACTSREQRVEVRERPEHRVDVLVVGDVVAVVVLRRGVDRRQPDHVDAELREVVEPRARCPPRSPIPSPSESANERG